MQAMKKLAVMGVAVMLLTGMGGCGATSGQSSADGGEAKDSEPKTAMEAARKYLKALTDGDAKTIKEMSASGDDEVDILDIKPSTPAADAKILTKDIPDGATRATLEISFKVAGEKQDADLTVERRNGKWVVTSPESVATELRISTTYRKLYLGNTEIKDHSWVMDGVYTANATGEWWAADGYAYSVPDVGDDGNEKNLYEKLAVNDNWKESRNLLLSAMYFSEGTDYMPKTDATEMTDIEIDREERKVYVTFNTVIEYTSSDGQSQLTHEFDGLRSSVSLTDISGSLDDASNETIENFMKQS